MPLDGPGATPVSARPRVAFVDDSEELRRLALEIFTKHGMDVFAVERESVSLDELAAWDPDVLIIDPEGGPDSERAPFELVLQTPGSDGLAHIPIVLLSTPWAVWQHEMEIRSVRPRAIVTKPFAVAELIATISSIVAEGKSANAR